MSDPHDRPIFVGEDRHQAVDELVAAFDRVAAGQGPELVCLVAPVGWGKTRIVQEFYARLAAERQGDPPYWPPSIIDATDVVEPTRLRKRIYPGGFTTAGGATPDWLWWGLSCERKAVGRPAQAIEEAKVQLFAHAEAIEQRLGSATRLRRSMRREQADYGMAALAGLLGVFVPPVGWVATAHDSVRQLWEWGQVVADERRRRRRAERDRVIDAEEADRLALVKEMAESLVLVSGAPLNLPIVIVVDDAHDAADSTITLVDRLLTATNAKVLIVATAWPDELALQERDGRGFGAWLARAAPDRAHRLELERLEARSLGALVRAVAPLTRPEVVDALVARSGGNPFVLDLILSLGMVRRSIVNQAITLSGDELAVVPSELRRLYLAKWQELPEALRDVLAVASLQGAEFVVGCAQEGATAIGLVEAVDVLPEAVAPYAWVRELDDELRSFVEIPQFDVAAAEASAEFTPGELAVARQALVSYVITSRDHGEWEELSTEARRTLLENHVRLAREGFDTDPVEAAHSALELAQLLAESHRYAEAATLGEQAAEWFGDDPRSALIVWDGVARWLGEAGRPNEAVERLRRVVDQAQRLLDPHDPVVLEMKSDLVAWLGEAGRVEEALSEGADVVDQLTVVLGADHPDTFAARVNLAVSMGDGGRIEEAMDLLQQVLNDQRRVLGPEDPATFATRSNLAFLLAESGRAAESAARFEELLADQGRVLGADHPDTLVTRAHVAASQDGRRGDPGLLDELLRVLGPHHPDALRARADRASAFLDAGNSEEASIQLEAVYLDHVRVLGADAPDTVTVRGNLVQALWDAGRLDDAVVHLTGLVEDQRHVLDPDDPDTLWFREQLGRLLLEAGRLDEAAAAFSALIEDITRVQGADDQRALAARGHSMGVLRRMGHLDEAIHGYRALADDCRRVLGADDPDTLTVLNEFAETAAATGLLEEAVTIMHSVVAGRARVLGEDDPVTFHSRERLGSMTAALHAPTP